MGSRKRLPMYTQTTDQSLTFVLEGTEQALALRAKIRIEVEDITSVEWKEKFYDWPKMLVRMPGSYLPSWIMAGSYWTDDGWDFVFAKKPKGLIKPMLFDVLVITTSKNRYKRVIIRMKKKQAKEIESWFKRVRKN